MNEWLILFIYTIITILLVILMFNDADNKNSKDKKSRVEVMNSWNEKFPVKTNVNKPIKLKRKCNACNQINPENSSWCTYCGSSLK